MKNTQVSRMIAYHSRSVNQQLLLHNEYLISENGILRSHLPARILSWRMMCLVLFVTGAINGQEGTELDLSSGKKIFETACAACHGTDAKGAPDKTVGFAKPKTFPDFTQCDQTTPELNKDWKATILEG